MENIISLEYITNFMVQTENKINQILSMMDELINMPRETQKYPMDIQQAAEFLKKSIHTIYRLCSKQEIPYCKKGKKLYFNQDDLKGWLESGRCKTKYEIDREIDNFTSNPKY